MEKNQCRSQVGPVFRKIQIEFQLDVVGFCISDVWEDVVVAGSVVEPMIRARLTVRTSADYADYADQEKSLRKLWIAFLFYHVVQKLNRIPKRHCRDWLGPYVAVTKPKLAAVTSEAGLAKFAWFVAFSASARN